MELEGQLTAFPLPEVLQFLAHGRMTGVLSVVSGDSEVRLEIREGRIIHSSTMDRPTKLGEMLVHRGVIQRRELEQTLEIQQTVEPGRLIGELLVEHGLVTEDQIRNAIKLQMEEEIWDIFRWREGHFKFEHTDPGQQRPSTAEIEIEPLLLEDSRRWDEWDQIVKNIPDSDAVFAVTPPDRESLKDVQIQQREWEVLRLINGRCNVSSIIARTGFGTFETYRTLNSLMVAGLAAPRDPAALDAPGAPDARPFRGLEQRASAINPAPAAEAAKDPPSAIWRFAGLLGRKKVGSNGHNNHSQAAKTAEARFVTPVGLCAAYVNDLMQTLMTDEAFRAADTDRSLIETEWRDLVNICPKADLIVARGNRLEPDEFEAFMFWVGREKTQSCYEDAMEALRRLVGRIHALASQRLGDRNAQRIIESKLDEWSSGARLELYQEFKLEAFLAKSAK